MYRLLRPVQNLKDNWKQKMQSFNRQHTISCSIAKQGGFMPSYWSAINNSLVNLDRTPEGHVGVRGEQIS